MVHKRVKSTEKYLKLSSYEEDQGLPIILNFDEYDPDLVKAWVAKGYKKI